MQDSKDYFIKSTSENPAVDWAKHEFNQTAIVLGLDIGIEGIGVWLRKGPKPIFYRTFKVTLPKAAPLEDKREKRTGRRTRRSRKHRDYLLRQWCQKWGLINEKDLQRLFAAPKQGEKPETHKPFELRFRAITKKLGGPQALVICLRHIIRHRGYDYHLTNDGTYPWGDELTPSEVIKWAKRSVCSPILKKQIMEMFLIQGWLEKGKRSDGLSDEKRRELEEDNRKKVEDTLNTAVATYHDDPIRKAIEENLREQRHTNLRTAIRGEENDHPRELIKKHIIEICQKHAEFFGGEEKMAAALAELIGKDFGKKGTENKDFEENCIIDYHRKNEKERREHAQRKAGKCPFSESFFQRGHYDVSRPACIAEHDRRMVLK
jgi:CRISPR/Cas system Type II protein with McrA/HNH and RuvC-like nuclease domain